MLLPEHPVKKHALINPANTIADFLFISRHLRLTDRILAHASTVIIINRVIVNVNDKTFRVYDIFCNMRIYAVIRATDTDRYVFTGKLRYMRAKIACRTISRQADCKCCATLCLRFHFIIVILLPLTGLWLTKTARYRVLSLGSGTHICILRYFTQNKNPLDLTNGQFYLTFRF